MREHTTPEERGTGARGGGHGFETRLVRLEDMSGYKVASDDPDVVGWAVKTRDGNTVGKVETLIIDTNDLKARYLEVELDRDALKLDQRRNVTLPIGNARIDESNDFVILPEHSPVELAALPESAKVLSSEEEQRIRRNFDQGSGRQDSEDFYAHPQYDPGRFYGARRSGRENQDYLTRVGEQSMGEDAKRQTDPGAGDQRRH